MSRRTVPHGQQTRRDPATGASDATHLLASFKYELSRLDALSLVQRRITSGACAQITDDQYADLKHHIAARYSISHADILVVGSAKLGFSIAPRKRYRAFGEDSDIDVAIVSTSLYNQIWRDLAGIQISDPTFNWADRSSFALYHLKGWVRPDKLPHSPGLIRRTEWFEFFRELTSAGTCGPFKISAGIYYDLTFLEMYQERAVQMCMESLQDEKGSLS
ncbi:hypothetical protein [Calidifontibacter indicus]|uniref:hypothetical protein n=1 Tax=Calidifontibacter indicus TaxID=419650 RepID=UPI003D7556A0